MKKVQVSAEAMLEWRHTAEAANRVSSLAAVKREIQQSKHMNAAYDIDTK